MRAPLVLVLVAILAACTGSAIEEQTFDLTDLGQVELTEGASGPAGTHQAIPITRQRSWRYYDGPVDQGTAWRTGTVSWPSAPAPLGYGESYLATTISYGSNPNAKPATAYFRTSFFPGAPVRKLYLRVMYDDGFVFYLNGHEGGRAHMPSGPITGATLATGHEAENRYVTYDISSQIPNLAAGENTLAIEVHQQSRASSDLVFDAELIVWLDGPQEDVSDEGIPIRDYWSFWDQGGDLGTAWRQPAYDDTAWSAAFAPMGYGEEYLMAETNPGAITTYFRKDFRARGTVTQFLADVMYDDGFVAYLNGQEIARVGLPAGTITGQTLASGHEANQSYQRFDWSAALPFLVDGVNTLAVEVHQNAATSSDLVFDLGLELVGGWRKQVSGTTANLNGVWFIDAHRGWVVGDGGTLLRTTDGGATWTPQATGTGEPLRAIQFVGADGWIVGDAGIVVQSHDGGETWEATATQTVFNLADLWFVDGRGWFLQPRESVIYRSDDGFQDWDAPRLPEGDWDALRFADRDRGWAVGSVPVPNDSWAAIYSTSDGGDTWTRQWIADGHFFYLFDLDVVSAQTVWATGESSLSGVGEHKLVTHDGGVTWTLAAETENNAGIFGIDFVDESHGWGVGHHGSIIHSADSGVTWQIQQVTRGELGTLQDVHFVDVTHGWAVGDAGVIMATTTGGD